MKKKNPESTSSRLVVIPYVKGLSEITPRIMKYERTCVFKPRNTRSTAVQGQGLVRLDEDGRHNLQDSGQRLPQFIYLRNHQTVGGQAERVSC